MLDRGPELSRKLRGKGEGSEKREVRSGNKGTLTDRAESSWSMRFNSAANLYLLAFVTGYCDRLRHRATISHFLSYPYSFLYCFFFFLRFFLSRKVLFYLGCLEEDYSKRIRFQIVWQVRWIFSLLCKLLFSHIFTNIQIYRNFRNFGIGFKSK